MTAKIKNEIEEAEEENEPNNEWKVRKIFLSN
jgi:hypothetical protein